MRNPISRVFAGAAAAGIWHRAAPEIDSTRSPPVIPVTVAQARTQEVPIYLSAQGTVQAWNTIAVRSQIDGKLTAVNFVEGQDVRAGDTLAQIDPSALKATLDQAIAKKGEDDAQLAAAQKDFDRAAGRAARQAIPQQQLDLQQEKTDQLRATVAADRAAISAQVQLGYATITAPVDGRVSLRYPGNIIHANDTHPLTVLTLIRPSAITYTLPQKSLFDVREAMVRGPPYPRPACCAFARSS
jgi:membrane fusion protein, multidrug efflux system